MSERYPSPRALLERHGLSAKRSWGQNFLADTAVAERFVDSAELEPDDVVLEIGAGLGHLTHRLVGRCRRLIAVERDRDLVPVLEAQFADNPTVEILAANAAKLDLADLSRRLGRRPVVVGNLPYQLTSPILLELLDGHQHVRRALLGVQREVAERLCADVGSRVSGQLTVLLALHFDLRLLFGIGAGSYTPRPKVASSVMRLEALRAPAAAVADEPLFRKLVRAAFHQRRKMLRSALASDRDLLPDADWSELLASVGIGGDRRGETLSLAEFAALTEAVASRRGG